MFHNNTFPLFVVLLLIYYPSIVAQHRSPFTKSRRESTRVYHERAKHVLVTIMIEQVEFCNYLLVRVFVVCWIHKYTMRTSRKKITEIFRKAWSIFAFSRVTRFFDVAKTYPFFFFVILCQVVCASIFKYVLHDQALESRIARDTFNDDFQKKKLIGFDPIIILRRCDSCE